MFLLGFSDDVTVTIIIFALSTISAIAVAWEKIRKKANNAELAQKIHSEVLQDFKEKIEPIEKDIERNSFKIDAVSQNQIESDKINSITGDRVKGIYHSMGKMSMEVSGNLSKMEDNLKKEIKDIGKNAKIDLKERKEECKESNKEVRGHIEKLYEGKQDKEK
jgi:hypothetical protein